MPRGRRGVAVLVAPSRAPDDPGAKAQIRKVAATVWLPVLGVGALVVALFVVVAGASQCAWSAEPKASILITVFSCDEDAPYETYNAHTTDAAQKFVAANPETCGAGRPEPVFGPKTAAQCRSKAFTKWQWDWIARNPGRKYLYAECFEEARERLDMEAVKRKVTP